MDAGLVVAVVLALAFAFTNGFHDAANSIATLVATRAAAPGRALVLAVSCIFFGPFLVGAGVANTIAGIVDVEPGEAVAVVSTGLVAALVWNVATWYRGLPSSSSHALVGGLSGAALAEAGWHAVNWGGFDGWRPVGVGGVLVGLAVAPLLGALAAHAVLTLLRRGLRRATRRFELPILDVQWIASGLLAASQGANDVQKSVGVALAMASGTALGGWRIVRTIGRRIYDLRALDSLSSQAGSAGVILAASIAGAPVSSTHVVASSVVGVGVGRRRFSRIRWAVVTEMAVAWLTTIPATVALGAAFLGFWRLIS